jgi:NAD(P)-dependent dehydrogenase (short-subunit alcohol dehydrogenase family)
MLAAAMGFSADTLHDRIAIVTGASQGIGRAIAVELAKVGAHVVACSRRRAAIETVAAAVRAEGRHALGLACDVGEAHQVDEVVARTIDEFGRIDLLVNNAGYRIRSPLEDLPRDEWDAMVRTNLTGVFLFSQAVGRLMIDGNGGSIVNIASVAGHRAGYSVSIFYGIVKAASIHLARSAAMELGEDGVRVNSISPGGIATGIFAKAMGKSGAEADATAEKVKEALATRQAIPRAGLPDDIASAALFLASDESGFVNGEDIVVDGGMIWGRRWSEVNAGGPVWKSLFD